MKIIFLNGGLANQTFQYIFYRYAELSHPAEDWYLDDSFFYAHQVHNGYELERVFGLQPRLLSRYFEPDVWDYMMRMKREKNISVPQMLKENGIAVRMIAETTNCRQWNPFNGPIGFVSQKEFHPEILDLPPEPVCYYHGYWLRREWLYAYPQTLFRELSFPQITDARNLAYLSEITRHSSTSVHVRRGDFASSGIAMEDAFYHEMIETILEQVPETTLFVFSDDMEYCRAHADAIGLNLPEKTVYVTGNSGENAFRDLQLMSCCKNMLINNSSFCYLAGLLNRGLQYAVNPTPRQL